MHDAPALVLLWALQRELALCRGSRVVSRLLQRYLPSSFCQLPGRAMDLTVPVSIYLCLLIHARVPVNQRP